MRRRVPDGVYGGRTRIPVLSLRLSPISRTYVMTRLGLPIPGWPMGKLAVALVVRCVKGEKTHDQGSAGPRGCGIASSGHQTSPLKPLERPRAERNTPGLSKAAPGRRENPSCDTSSSYSWP